MKKALLTVIFLLVWLTAVWSPAAQSGSDEITASELLKQIQHTYGCGSFQARFDQTSTLKAMDITDTASGRAYFMEPGKMRWEYVEPEPQQIITDGKRLWIYKPQENQVLTGDASALFGEGQGVSFLAAISTIAEKNAISIDHERQKDGYYTLKLVPDEKTADIEAIYFYVSKQSGLVEELETINAYDDITRIVFSDIRLGGSIDSSLFTFTPPEGADVLLLDQKN